MPVPMKRSILILHLSMTTLAVTGMFLAVAHQNRAAWRNATGLCGSLRLKSEVRQAVDGVRQRSSVPCRVEGDTISFPFEGFGGYVATYVAHTHGGLIDADGVTEAH